MENILTKEKGTWDDHAQKAQYTTITMAKLCPIYLTLNILSNNFRITIKGFQLSKFRDDYA